MIRTVIFDLSEVLISGLVGIESSLAHRVGMSPEAILQAFGGDHLDELLHGRSTEEEYLAVAFALHGWDLDREEVKSLIRRNFHNEVPGMRDVLDALARRHELVLLSDHSAEWVDYIRRVHPFLARFDHQFFSCDLGSTKRSSRTFLHVLEALGRKPAECLFIDDSRINVEVARALGLHAVRFTDADGLREELRRLGIEA